MSEKNITSLNTIKTWFKTGLKPTQAQFWAWLDSFWHKDEEIPQEKITGLAETLENKADNSAVEVKANADASELSEEQKQAWKEALEVGELPTNIALIDEVSDDGNKLGNVYTKTKSDELLGEKLDKPTQTATTTEAPFVVGVNADNESYKLPAGDLGKNMGNSNIFTTLLGKVTQGANYVWDTARYYFYIKNLPDKSADSTFSSLMVQDSNGQVAKVSKSSTVVEGMKQMTDAQKEAFRKASLKTNERFSTAQPRVDFVIPTKVSNEYNRVQYLGLFGINLFIDNSGQTPASVVFRHKTTRTEKRIENFQVFQTQPNILSIGENFSTWEEGVYQIEVTNQNGLQSIYSGDFRVGRGGINVPVNLTWEVLNNDIAQLDVQTNSKGVRIVGGNVKGQQIYIVSNPFTNEELLSSGLFCELSLYVGSSSGSWSANAPVYKLAIVEEFNGSYTPAIELLTTIASYQSESIKTLFGKSANTHSFKEYIKIESGIFNGFCAETQSVLHKILNPSAKNYRLLVAVTAGSNDKGGEFNLVVDNIEKLS